MTRTRKPLAPLQGAALAIGAVGVSLATFMQVLDSTIANVSVPTIAGSLGISATQGTWVITSFAASSAISMPLTGRLAERFGQVRVFIIATTLFIIASLMCGLAPNMQALVAARVVQGAVAGPMMPLSQTLMITMYPAARRGAALALWATIAVVAPVIGPILGSYISDNASWPWIFFINVPVGVVAIALAWSALRESESARHRPPVDVIGLALLAVWVGSLQVMLDLGSHENWFDSPLIVALAVLAGVTFCYFLVWELGDAHPIVDLGLFRNLNFAVGAGGAALIYATIFGGNVLYPLVMQTQLGYTATWAGLALAPVGIAPVVLMRFMGRNVHRLDPRAVASLGFLTIALVMWMRSRLTLQADFATLVEPQFLLGVGLILMSTPLNMMILSHLPADRYASALGLGIFMRTSAGSFGASIFTSLWQRREAVHHTYLAEAFNVYSPTRGASLDVIAAPGLNVEQGRAVLDAAVSQQASLLGANDIYWLTAWLIVLLATIVWFARPPFNAPVAAAASAE